MARKNAGYTQQSFVDSFGYVSIETVRNWEQGRNVPEIDTLDRLCDFFQCDLDYLFGKLDCKTHNKKYISELTGLTEKSIEVLELIRKESSGALPYGSYALGERDEDKVIGAR